MSISRHRVQAGKSHLDRYARQPAIDAVAELIWNGLDAEADNVEVRLERDSLGNGSPEFVTRVWVQDNGHGIEPPTAVERFTMLGDSWKLRQSGRTINGLRVLHGKYGRGRFYAYSLGHRVTWSTVWEEREGRRLGYQINGRHGSINEFEISEAHESDEQTGTEVEIRVEQGRTLSQLLDDEVNTKLCARFAPHLLGNTDIEVVFDGGRLDAARLVERQIEDETLTELREEDLAGHPPPVLRIIEWNQHVRGEMPMLVICNAGGAALAELDHKAGQAVRVTGYVLWSGFEAASADLMVVGMAHPSILEAARDRISAYVQERAQELRGTIVEQLREEGAYPYPPIPPDDAVQEAEQQLYDVTLVAARSALGKTKRERRMAARLMQVAVQTRTSEINDLIDEVLGLPPDIREILRDLLKDTTLADLVLAGNEVRTRIELLLGLRRLLYSPDTARRMLEVSQLQPLVRGNEWLFGEEWRLARSELSLTNVLRQVVPDSVVLEEHLIATGGQVVRSDGRGGRVDLLLQRHFRGPSGKPERLIVELKRPSLTLSPKELQQVRSYARALEQHEGVVSGHWTFWLVGTRLDEDLEAEADQTDREWGHVLTRPTYDIFVTRWSHLIEAAEQRLEFFRRQLNLEIGQEQAAHRLRERHGHLVPPMLTRPGT